jgi:HSP20 family protein
MMSDKKTGGLFGSLAGFIESIGDLADAAEQHKRSGAKETGSADGKTAAENKIGGILNGLADLAEKLKNASENGQSVSKNGEFTFPSKEGGVKGVYGFTMKTGLGEKGDQIKVEPFGNIRKDKKTGEAVVQEINEPQVDVFEDEGGTTLIAEMPGVGPEDIQLEVREDVLTVAAQKGEKKYRKELLLNHLLSKERIDVTCNNGIVTIRCRKAG